MMTDQPAGTWWDRWTDWATRVTGGRWAFGLSVIATGVWLCVGPFYRFSDTWQLWANTATTVITFLMVFVIQHAQNKDSAALHLKVDELLRADHRANNALRRAEELPEEDLELLRSPARAAGSGYQPRAHTGPAGPPKGGTAVVQARRRRAHKR